MIVGGERLADLRGVFIEAAVLWSALPSKCSKNKYFNCGFIEIVFSNSLLKLFDIRENPQEKRRLGLSVYSQNDGHGRGMARIFAEVDEKKATFLITSTGGGDNDARRMVLQREFGDGTGDIIQVRSARKDRDILRAFHELVDLHTEKMQAIDKDLLCRACTSKVNGLPGTIVGNE